MTEETTTVINVSGDLVAIGPLRRDLVTLYHQWNNDFVTSRTIGLSWPTTLEQECERYVARTQDSHAVWFTIYKCQDLRPVGLAWLYEIDHRHARASFGISIGDEHDRGHGFGTEATCLTLDYAFNALGVQNVMLTVLAFNNAGVRAYERAGFKVFGRRHHCSHANGQLHDLIYMECLSSEFTSPVLGRLLYDGDSNTRE